MMKRPHVICHMIPSVDGRIVTKSWRLSPSSLAEYEKTALTFKADAWLVGRISMAGYASRAKVPNRKVKNPISRTDFIAKHGKRSFAIVVDPSGKLNWRSSEIEGAHVITLLTKGVPDDYLAHLQSTGISYLFGGQDKIKLSRVLVKLRAHFGIRRLLLEGGGTINGSFLAAGLIDELSLLLAPVADGGLGSPTLFDVKSFKRLPVSRLKLLFMSRRKGDIVWLRYQVRR